MGTRKRWVAVAAPAVAAGVALALAGGRADAHPHGLDWDGVLIHDGFASYLDHVHEVLDEFRCDILDLVIDDPRAFARMRFSGIHRSEVFGYQPTGKRVEWAGAALFIFKGGRVADLWVLGDVHGLLQLLERNASAEASGPAQAARHPSRAS